MIKTLSILWHYAQARRNFRRWRDRAALERWQEHQVEGHFSWVRKRSSYYAGLAGEGAWRQIPVQSKATLMAHFQQWNTASLSLEEASRTAEQAERTRDFSATLRGLTVGLSSGTSGSRGIFLASAVERHRWAGVLLARCLQGTLAQEHRAALFLRADSTLYQNLGSRRLSFSFFDLLLPMATHAERLHALRPTLLAAPPAVLVALARLPGADAIMAPPSLVLSVADVLDAAERAEIEAAFGTRVGQLYQATEGFLAATCPHGALHWNEDNILVEKAWLDKGRTHYYPVITDFRRTTQPMIRYQMDDVIAEGEHSPCPCGSVFGVLGAIAGRKDDVLQLAALDGGESTAIFPDFVRRAIVLGVSAGVEYRVRQSAPSHWDIFLSDLSAAPAVSAEVGLLCEELRVQAPALDFFPWSPEPLIHKQRRVQCLL